MPTKKQTTLSELLRHEGPKYPIPGVLEDHQVRPLTQQLITAVLFDVWPSIAAIVDFGIDSDRHLGALQFAIKYDEVTPQELDAAMGSGAKLTEIAQRGNNPYRDVTFRTSWDKMRLEPQDEPPAAETAAPEKDRLKDVFGTRDRQPEEPSNQKDRQPIQHENEGRER